MYKRGSASLSLSYFFLKRYTACKPMATPSAMITQAKLLLPSHVSSLITTIMTIIREAHNRTFILLLIPLSLVLLRLLYILSPLSPYCFSSSSSCIAGSSFSLLLFEVLFFFRCFFSGRDILIFSISVSAASFNR